MKQWHELLVFYEHLGHLEYAGEGVTQLQHAWQCGQLARRAGASPALQAAAWLHDVGHLLDGAVETPTLRGHDDHHERRGAALIGRLLGSAVAHPVALHVEAKRYLVTTRTDYAARLSEDSQRSLALQGGPMAPSEAEHWRGLPHADDALRLRVWDDLAKDTDWRPASSAHALSELESLLAQCAGLLVR